MLVRSELHTYSTNPQYKSRTPTTANDIVKYVWTEVNQTPATPTPEESLRFFDENIVYEDFNYESAFVGKPALPLNALI